MHRMFGWSSAGMGLFAATMVAVTTTWIGVGCETSRVCSSDEDCFEGQTCRGEECVPIGEEDTVEPTDTERADTESPEDGEGSQDIADGSDTVQPSDTVRDTADADGGATPRKLDLLWVIDNSGSMCQQQRALRESFRQFLEELHQSSIDLHVGVTTTNYDAPFEVVSPSETRGRLQSTPHPPTGFDQACRKNPGADDPYAVLRRQIEAAVACTNNPGEFQQLKEWSDDEIACALEGQDNSEAYQKAGLKPEEFTLEQLFPCGYEHGGRCNSLEQLKSVYRDIPKVLKTADYTTNDGVDLEAFQRDLGCMSYVGTRGDSMEQGLKAAVEAVSPEKTGGPVGDPHPGQGGENAPNHGLIRKEAQTAVMFISDENDCSHPEDVNLQDEFGCGEMGCYYPTASESDDQEPLFATQALAEEFLENLTGSKGVDRVDPSEVVVGSIHGTYRRYGAEPDQEIQTDCGAEQTELREAAHVCDTALGPATSGDRYEDFLTRFERLFPERGEDGHLKGWMCEGGIERALEEFATTLRAE